MQAAESGVRSEESEGRPEGVRREQMESDRGDNGIRKVQSPDVVDRVEPTIR
jgi:hypothetical protein